MDWCQENKKSPIETRSICCWIRFPTFNHKEFATLQPRLNFLTDEEKLCILQFPCVVRLGKIKFKAFVCDDCNNKECMPCKTDAWKLQSIQLLS